MKKIIIQSKKNTQGIAQNNTNILKAEDIRNDGMSQKPSVPSGFPGVLSERILVWMLAFVLYALPSIEIFSGSKGIH